MDLVYLWVRKYGCIENQEVHFENKFDIDLDLKEKKVHIRENSNLIDCFWKKKGDDENYVKNIHAFVGGNGSGKTTLLKFIAELMVGRYNEGMGDIIFIRYNMKDQKIIVFDTMDISVECAIEYIKEKLYIKNYGIMKSVMPIGSLCNNTTTIYSHKHFEVNNYIGKMYPPIIDLSIGGLMRYDFEHGDNIVLNYAKKTFNRKMDFILNFMNNDTNENMIKIPRNLTIEVEENFKIEDTIIKRLSESDKKYEEVRKKFNALTNCILKCNQKNIYELWKDKLGLNIMLNGLSELLIEPTTSNDYEERVKNFRDFIYSREWSTDLDWTAKIVFEKIVKTLGDEKYINVKEYKAFFEYLQSEEFFVSRDMLNFDSVVSIEINEGILGKLKKFHEFYTKVWIPNKFLRFNWGLSTGEMNLLTFYSDLYSIKKMPEYNKENDGILVLIDEADLTYHPELQIKYIDYLLTMLPKMFPKLNIQVILTTHSPLLLSDIPSFAITYLNQKQSNKLYENFGQNVYNLFKYSFSMDDSIGSFAKGKIDEVYKLLNKIREELEQGECSEKINTNLNKSEKIINLIGERIIRDSLQDKLYELKKIIKEKSNKKQESEVVRYYQKLSDAQKEELIELILNEDKV